MIEREEGVEDIAKIIDPDAWHETLPTDGCGVYWLGRRNDARSKAKLAMQDIVARLEKGQAVDGVEWLSSKTIDRLQAHDPDHNKAGGLWYRRWFKAQERVNELERLLENPPRHRFWGAGEADCPRDIKAGNGELHTLRCKACGQDNPRDQMCLATPKEDNPDGN